MRKPPSPEAKEANRLRAAQRYSANPELMRKRARESMRKARAERGDEINATFRAWYARTKGARREKLQRQRRAWRGLPHPDRPEPALCECCGGAPNGRGGLHLDHNHKTGHFRGWLCHKCNVGIGHLGDSVEGLQRALYYMVSIANDDLF